jgi:hypothetical protein
LIVTEHTNASLGDASLGTLVATFEAIAFAPRQSATRSAALPLESSNGQATHDYEPTQTPARSAVSNDDGEIVVGAVSHTRGSQDASFELAVSIGLDGLPVPHPANGRLE